MVGSWLTQPASDFLQVGSHSGTCIFILQECDYFSSRPFRRKITLEQFRNDFLASKHVDHANVTDPGQTAGNPIGKGGNTVDHYERFQRKTGLQRSRSR